MLFFRAIAVLMTVTALNVSCSVLSSEVKREAIPPVPFRALASDAESYKGKTVILGGYTKGVETALDETFIVVAQAPLNSLDEPRSRTLSEGAFIIRHKGPLRNEAYEEGWPITVAGVVEGLTDKKFADCPKPCLQIKSKEIYVRPSFIPDPMTVPAGSGGGDVWDSPYPSNWYR